MKKISIINFKGGVGKTTLSLHLACHLAETSRVLVVDVDHQSSLSNVILGTSQWDKQVSANHTINRVFESFANRRVPMPGTEIIVKNPFHLKRSWQNFYPNLDIVPAQFELDDTEIDLASTSYGNASLSDWEKRTLIANWLDSINAKSKYDYILFDCPPATKIVSQNALSCSDGYIVPVIPDDLSSRGVSHFRGLVENKVDERLKYLRATARLDDAQVPENYVADTKMAAIAPSIVKVAGRAASGYTNIHTEQLTALRNRWGPLVINRVGENQIGIPEAVNAGWPVWQYWGGNARRAVKTMMTHICQELKIKIDAL